MNLNNMRIGTRLGASFGVLLLLLGVLAFVAVQEIRTLKADLDRVVHEERGAALAEDWMWAVQVNQARTQALVLGRNDAQLVAHFEPRIHATSEQIAAMLADLDPRITSAEGRALLARVVQTRTDFVAARLAVFDALRAGDNEGAIRLLNESLLPREQVYIDAIKAMVQLQRTQVEGFVAQAQNDASRALWLLGIMAALALLLGIVVALWAVRSITRPLGAAVAELDAIAHGDLSRRVQVDRKDEVGAVQQRLAEMQTALQRVVLQIRQAGDGVAVSASEIAQGNQDLSSRTEQAASSLEQTASSMEQLTATVKQTADSARQANQLAASAAQVAQKGGAVVSQVVHTMNDISSSSQRISDIISVIDGIAFQTNILALNAAVEAARAGEQGRGFAVVATEVRSLAGRSAQAAKEIKDLIGASVDKVQNGSRLVQEAGATMDEIVSSVQRVSDIIGEITAAAAEQSEGIGQVNVAVNQLDQMTQQNAALVEQSTAASESLREQAARLAEAIGAFRTGTDSGQAAQTAAVVPRARPSAPSAAAKSGAGAMTSRLGQAAVAPAHRAVSVRPTHAKPASATTLPKPRPHPDAAAKALPGAQQAPAPARAAGSAAAAPKALPNRSNANANSKPAGNVEGEWESF